MIGKTFGRWTIVSEAPSRRESKRSVARYYNARCVCGTEKEVRASSLRTKKSNGCKKCAKRLPDGVAALNAFWLSYKYGAKLRGLRWSLSKKQFEKLVTSLCFYCGASPLPRMGITSRSRRPAMLTGVDRADSSKSYTKQNCVPCCKTCNLMKGSLSSGAFLIQVSKIYKNKKEN
jgi:hypothetical protein